MSLIKRISNLVRSNVNDMLDKAEDPQKILDQTILDMQEEHKKAKKMLLDTMTLLKQAEKQNETNKKQAGEWEQKAMIALKGGDETLARKALEEKSRSEELAAEGDAGTVSHRAHTEELKRNLKALEEKIEEAKKKRDELVNRLRAADMKKKQAAIHDGDVNKPDAVRDSSAFDTFNRMVEKIENSEAEVEARAELSGTTDSVADWELKKALDSQNADDALAKLKAKMSESGAASATPAPTTTPAKPDAIEDELAKLRAKLDGG